MLTAIVSRQKEFAMIQSIGMTKRQLRSMLIDEGLYYAGSTLLASYVLGALAVGSGVRMMAVSYTHLDVYKRQHQCSSLLRFG